jgi:4-alpha-glucanotransferase
MRRRNERAGMTDAQLQGLAEAAGVQCRWEDVSGQQHEVSPETLRAVLAALGLPVNSAEAMQEAQALLAQAAQRLPPLLTMTCGPDGVAIPGAEPRERYRLVLEDGQAHEGRLEQGWAGEARLPALNIPGYHRLELGGLHCLLAAAPPRCLSLAEMGAERHHDAAPWALTAQLYSLRRAGDLGIGDFTGAGELARSAARYGASALALSPLHAQFSADTSKYSPYAPSTRLLLNVLYADPQAALLELPAASGEGEAADLIDWPTAARRKLARLRVAFERAADHPGFVAFRNQAGPALEEHARFEALHAHFYGSDPALWHWRKWPDEFRTPDSPGVHHFVQEHAQEVAFHAFCQWLADASLAAAQREARKAGMPIGLIADLAVGTDDGGSHAWARQDEIIGELSVGAPPDIFSPLGQDWGLTAFSPLQMRLGGFHAFLELLRASMRHAGGLRVDHAMGLQRLWVVPRGAGPAEGAYLSFPVDDLLRLLALESHRHRCIVIGEDLGTLPHGFHGRMATAGILGMRVLWFEQERDGSFRQPRHWSRDAAAMTTTHDLPTVAGWWKGRDIDWREKLNRFPSSEVAQQQRERREEDRKALWRAMLESGAAEGDQPRDAEPVVDAALVHVGSAACELAMLPLEDALGLEEQPNLPGTTDGHPNWRRRLAGEAAHLLDQPAVARRLGAFARARRRPAT